jgi:hypothetical protein
MTHETPSGPVPLFFEVTLFFRKGYRGAALADADNPVFMSRKPFFSCSTPMACGLERALASLVDRYQR